MYSSNKYVVKLQHNEGFPENLNSLNQLTRLTAYAETDRELKLLAYTKTYLVVSINTYFFVMKRVEENTTKFICDYVQKCSFRFQYRNRILLNFSTDFPLQCRVDDTFSMIEVTVNNGLAEKSRLRCLWWNNIASQQLIRIIN